MLDLLSVQITVLAAVVLAGFFSVFHVLVIVGVVPGTIVWGGRLSERRHVVWAEVASILLLSATALVFFLNGQSLATGERGVVLTVATWVLVVLFGLNTVGNLFAKTALERFAFTPITLVLTLLALRLALEGV